MFVVGHLYYTSDVLNYYTATDSALSSIPINSAVYISILCNSFGHSGVKGV